MTQWCRRKVFLTSGCALLGLPGHALHAQTLPLWGTGAGALAVP